MRSVIKCPYYYFDSVIPDQMCDLIVELGQSKEQNIAGINTDNEKDDMRQGHVAWITESWVQELIEIYAKKATEDANWHFNIDSKEHIQFATYENNDYYDYHRDCDQNLKPYRKISVSVQLSDPNDYEGGDLKIKHLWGKMDLPMDLRIKNKGTIIVFPSVLLHTVTPVTKGIRHSLVQWFGGPDFV